MSFESALRSRLLGDGAVTALVGTRIDVTARPQLNALPAVVLQLVSDARPQTYGGFQAYRDTRVQIDVFAKTRAATVEIREAVIAALAPEASVSGVSFRRALIDSVRDAGSNTDTGFVHRDIIDVIFWHNA